MSEHLQPGRWTSRGACGAAAFVALVLGCAPQAQRSDFEATGVGGAISEVRRLHGGLEHLRRFGGVEFAYRAKHLDGTLAFDRVAFRFDDSRHIWVRSSADDELCRVDLSQETGTLFAAPVSEGGLLEASEIQPSVLRNPTADFALRTLRIFFEPALMSGVGRWEVRSLIAPPGVADDIKPVEIGSRDPHVPEGPYLVEADRESGLIARVLYRASHPFTKERTHRVTFSDYATIDGFAIARERLHSRPPIRPGPNLEANPFRPSPASIDVLREEIDGVRFLSHDAVERNCPLPEKDLLSDAGR